MSYGASFCVEFISPKTIARSSGDLRYTSYMIRSLEGSVIDVMDTSIVVSVGGVGYLVHIADTASYRIDEAVTVYTYLAVRENALDLYGFSNRDTLQVFQMLIELPKIGPKSAAQILHQADITLLKEAVRNDDPSYLAKMAGIGKKSPEKIVAGLKDTFEKAGYIDEGVGTVGGTAESSTLAADTIDALITLGYPQSDARRVLQQVQKEHPEITSSAEAVKLALQQLNQSSS